MPAFRVRLAVVLALGAIVCWAMPHEAPAQSRSQCAGELMVAQNRYLDGRFDDAVTLLRECLDRETLSAEEAVRVYRLICLASLNKGDQEQARQAIRDLLRRAPDYQADPVQDPPSYARLVDGVRQEVAAQAAPEAPPVAEEEDPPADPAEEDEPPADPAEEDEPPADPVEEEDPQTDPIEEEEPPVEAEEDPEAQPEADQPDETPPVLPPISDDPSVSPVGGEPVVRRGLLRTPRSWLLATGGAIVVATAVALAFGGSAESSPAPPR